MNNTIDTNNHVVCIDVAIRGINQEKAQNAWNKLEESTMTDQELKSPLHHFFCMKNSEFGRDYEPNYVIEIDLSYASITLFMKNGSFYVTQTHFFEDDGIFTTQELNSLLDQIATANNTKSQEVDETVNVINQTRKRLK